MSNAISSTTTWVVRFQLGHVTNRQFEWDADGEIVITCDKPIYHNTAIGFIQALYGRDQAFDHNIEIQRL